MIWYPIIVATFILFLTKNPFLAFGAFIVTYWILLWYDPSRKYSLIAQEVFDKPIIFEGNWQGRIYMRTLFNPKLIKGANLEQVKVLLKADYLGVALTEAVKRIYPNGEEDLKNAKFDIIVGSNKYSPLMPVMTIIVIPPDNNRSTTEYFYDAFSYVTFSRAHKLHASAMFPIYILAKERGWKPIQNVVVCVPSTIKYNEDFAERLDKISALGRIESAFYTAIRDALANAQLAKTFYNSMSSIKRYDEMVLSKLNELSSTLALVRLELDASRPLTEDEILSRYIVRGKAVTAPKAPSPIYLLIVIGAAVGSYVAERYAYAPYVGALVGGIIGYILTMVNWSAVLEKITPKRGAKA